MEGSLGHGKKEKGKKKKKQQQKKSFLTMQIKNITSPLTDQKAAVKMTQTTMKWGLFTPNLKQALRQEYEQTKKKREK